jgi:hypothetical protein
MEINHRRLYVRVGASFCFGNGLKLKSKTNVLFVGKFRIVRGDYSTSLSYYFDFEYETISDTLFVRVALYVLIWKGCIGRYDVMPQ